MANADDIRSALLKLRAFLEGLSESERWVVAAMLSDDAGDEVVGFDDTTESLRLQMAADRQAAMMQTLSNILRSDDETTRRIINNMK